MFASYPQRRRALRFPVLLGGLALVGAACADDIPLSLDAAADLAVRQAPLMRAHMSRIDAAREDAVRAGRLPDPELNFGVNNLPIEGADAFRLGHDMMTMQTVGVTQRLPSGALREAEREVARAGIDMAEADHDAGDAEIRQATASAWIALWAARQKRDLLVALRDEAELGVAASRARLAGASGSASDAIAARGEAMMLDNRVDAAGADIAAAEAGLQRRLGAAAQRPLADAPDFAILPIAPERLLARIDRQAPLLGWPAREHAAAAALDRARAGKHPDWQVGVAYGARSGYDDMVMVQIGVGLPLFGHDRQDRNVSARSAELDAVHDEAEDARRAQTEAVQRQLAAWQGWSRQVQRYREQLLPLARDRAHTALAAYRGGDSLQAWLDARRDEVRLRLDYADALMSWGNTWAGLAYLLPKEATP